MEISLNLPEFSTLGFPDIGVIGRSGGQEHSGSDGVFMSKISTLG